MDTSNLRLCLPSLPLHPPFWILAGSNLWSGVVFHSKPDIWFIKYRTSVLSLWIHQSLEDHKHITSCPADISKVCINWLITSIWNWPAASCSYWVWLSLERWQKPCCGRPLVWQIPLWKHWVTVHITTEPQGADYRLPSASYLALCPNTSALSKQNQGANILTACYTAFCMKK